MIISGKCRNMFRVVRYDFLSAASLTNQGTTVRVLLSGSPSRSVIRHSLWTILGLILNKLYLILL